MADAHKNFAISTIVTAPSPASSGTTATMTTGHGTRFPAVPFNASIGPNTDPISFAAVAEIVRVTAVSGNSITAMTRAQEGTSARSIVAGDIIDATITALTLTDVEFPWTTTSATAFAVGPAGATNPSFQVNCSTASAITGLKITSAASGSGVTLAATGGTNEALTLSGKGNLGVQVVGTTGSAAGGIRIVGTNVTMGMFEGGGSDAAFGSISNHVVELITNNAVRMVVTTAGLFSLGTGVGTPTYVLHIAPTSGLTAGQTVFIQDATASSGLTKFVLTAGANQGTTPMLSVSGDIVTTGAANVGTLTNCPHTGNPALYWNVSINGTVYAIPAFALT